MLKGGEKAGRGLRNEKKGAKRRKKEKRGPTFQFFLSVSCFFFFFLVPFTVTLRRHSGFPCTPLSLKGTLC